VYNREMGEWDATRKHIEGDLPFGRSMQQLSLPAPAPNKQVADQWNVALGAGSEANRGVGSCVINGEPAAAPFGHVIIKGARAGVDGEYMISEVQHQYSRSGGFITTLYMKFPLGDPANAQLLRSWDWSSRGELPTRWGPLPGYFGEPGK
jgi:hypothetical protein